MTHAIGFFTHYWDIHIQGRYEKLSREAGAPVYIVGPVGMKVPAALSDRVCFYDFARLAQAAPAVTGPSPVPGNCHLTMLEFSRQVPGHDFYWQVEYDVVFTGPWARFFEAWHLNPADLLVSHLRDYAQEPDWYWWPTLKVRNLNRDDFLRAFMPVYRISAPALNCLSVAVQEGEGGHFEGLVPTLLRQNGLDVQDFISGNFYTSSDSRNGILFGGTMRFRPDHPGGLRAKNTLYHPVKPGRKTAWTGYLTHWVRWFVHEPKAFFEVLRSTVQHTYSSETPST